MNDWGWVAFGYCVTFGVMIGYAVVLVVRVRSARRRLDRPN